MYPFLRNKPSLMKKVKTQYKESAFNFYKFREKSIRAKTDIEVLKETLKMKEALVTTLDSRLKKYAVEFSDWTEFKHSREYIEGMDQYSTVDRAEYAVKNHQRYIAAQLKE